MFKPKYSYTNKIVDNLGRIRELVAIINEKKFPNTILVQLEESAKNLSVFSSTSIEGNPLPLTDVKKVLKNKPENIKDTEEEVLNYNQALEELNKRIEENDKFKFSHQLVFDVHSKVVKGLVSDTQSGKYRRESVFVNDPRTGKTVYWPPNSEDVEKLMDDLISFVNKGEGKTESIIKAGIFHKQFVIIHPFIDGNGRTVRLLTKLLLAKLGLNTFQLFSFENYYNLNITEYFRKVGVFNNYYDIVNSIDFTQWIEYFTDGIIDELERVSKILPKATSLKDRLEDYHYEIIDLIKEKGVIKDSDYAEISDRSRASRILDYRKLVDLDLIERKGKGRGTYYVLKDY